MKRILPNPFLFMALICVANPFFAAAQSPAVEVMRMPESSLLPQISTDAAGTVHMIYAKVGEKEFAPGDLFYVRTKLGEKEFSKPIQVNSHPAGVAAWGPSTGGGQMAIGKTGRVHAVWNAPAPKKAKAAGEGAKPKGEGVGEKPKGGAEGPSMFYARLNDAGTDFEPQRHIAEEAVALDGLGTIAADGDGNVYVFWQARGAQIGEGFRRVYLSRSSDDGKTFSKQEAINPDPTGACSCCGLRALIGSDGRVFAAYRAAGGGVDRDSFLLYSEKGGSEFKSVKLGEWKIGACPASTFALLPTMSGVLTAWEFEDQIFFAGFDAATRKLSETVLAGGEGKGRKHPVIVENAKGQRLVAWNEGNRWKSCTAAWQVYGPDNKPLGEKGMTPGIPAYSRVAAFARPDGSFVIIF